MYSAVSVVGLAFALVFVPETKGRTLDEMQPKKAAEEEEDDKNDRKEEHQV